MRITKSLRKDQELLQRFLDVFGGGAAALGASNKHAQPGFFVLGSTFIDAYVDPVYFRKVDLLLKVLEENGFPTNSGAIGSMKSDQEKCHEAAAVLVKVAKDWQSGDAGARLEVGWAASEFTTALRSSLNRLKTLIFPLLEQNVPPEEEQKILDGVSAIASENGTADDEKHKKLIETLEEELSDWK